jgi:hypothetical protein
MRTLLEEKQVHTRIVAGTHWPVTHQLHRVQIANRKPKWVVMCWFCNGMVEDVYEFETLKEAKRFYASKVG